MQRLQQVEKLINLGKMEEALSIISSDTSNPANIKRSIIFEKMGEFEEALKYALLASKDTTPLIKVHGLVCQVYAFWRLDKLDKAQNAIDQGLELLDELTITPETNDDIVKFRAEFYYLQGIIYNMKGELKRPFNFFRLSYELRFQIDHPTKSHSLNAMGVIKELMGELIEALNYHEQALDLKREQNNKQDLYRSLNNIGMLYYKIGNFEKALAYTQEANELAAEAGYEEEQLAIKNQMAMLNQKLGNDEVAEKLFLEALEETLEVGTERQIANRYQSLISFYRKVGETAKSEEYLLSLYKLSEKSDVEIISVIYKIEHALDLMKNERIFFQMRGQQLLREALRFYRNNENADLTDMLSVIAHLIRALIQELSLKYNEDIIVEIHEFIQEIEYLSRKENLILTQIEAMEFVAKLRLLQGDVEDARLILTDAQLLAEEKGFSLRAKHIAEEYDRIIIHGIHQDERLSFERRMEELRIDDVLSRMTLDSPQPEHAIEYEEPIQIMVLNFGGNPIYSHAFDKDSYLNNTLIGSFLSAIQAFGNEIFSDNDSSEHREINRIEHLGYSILMKNTLDDQSFISYIFKGPSYHAVKRLLEFSQRIKEEGYWTEMMNSPFRINLEIGDKLDELIGSIFYND